MRRLSRTGVALWTLISPAVGLMLFSALYRLVMLAAAVIGRKRNLPIPRPETAERLRFAIVMPAKDEAGGIGAVLDSLRTLAYPAECYEVVVVADNCEDDTAAVARRHGATVLERHDPVRVGKGHALAWAISEVLATHPYLDAICILDADCQASTNLLSAIEARLLHGTNAVQAEVRVSNPGEAWTAALRFAAFALINGLRPRGKAALGLSCGLYGTGMAFSKELLLRQPWNAHSLAEDGEYHFRLVAQGETAEFAPEATIFTPMPVTLKSSGGQQMRWEGGRWEHIRARSFGAFTQGLRRRNKHQINAALDPLVLPQSIFAASAAGLFLVGLAARSRRIVATAAGLTLAHLAYVGLGLMYLRAPASVFRALLFSPVLIAWKLWIWARTLTRNEQLVWERSWREHDDVIREREAA